MDRLANLQISEIVAGGLGLCFLVVLFQRSRSSARLPLPPGPKGLPIIGNLLDLPRGPEWLHWAKHKALYGPISSVSLLGTNIIILNDMKVVSDLLEKRSAVYSDRPQMYFAKTMCGWGNALAIIEYGDRFRAMRKCTSKALSSRVAWSEYLPFVEVEARRTLLRVLNSPENALAYIRTYGASVVLGLSYGYKIEPLKPDPLVHLVDKAIHQFMDAAPPGRWLVDSFPFLRFLPEWMPGAGFKKIAREYSRVTNGTADIPFEFVKKQVAEGIAPPSFVSTLLKQGVSADEEFNIKWSAQALYAAGNDTSVSAMNTFLLAMQHYPAVLHRAQAEIDALVGPGPDRLITFSDREDLPYVNALAKETLRWGPIVPCNIPHMTTADDVYEGKLIPKGSIIISNIWQFLHDPDYYKDPMSFNPERFLGAKPEMDPKDAVFGFGRRICPGKDIGDHSVFLSIALFLTVFKISRAKDAQGHEIVPPVEWSSGTVSIPKNLTVSLAPRSEKAATLIRNVEVDHPFLPSDVKALEKLGLDVDILSEGENFH